MNENVESQTTATNSETESKLATLKARVDIFLEYGDWISAISYCEKILDISPTDATVYLRKLMAENKVSKKEQMLTLNVPIEDNVNYQKIMQFGDEDLKNELAEYNEQLRQTYQRRKSKKKRKTIAISATLSSLCVITAFVVVFFVVMLPNIRYTKAKTYLAEEEYQKAYEILCDLKGHKDSDALLREASWGVVYEYLENEGEFKLPIETSLILIQAKEDTILLGYSIYFEGELNVDAKYVASLKKDGSALILGVTDSSSGNSIEYVEAYGNWDITKHKASMTIEWETVNVQQTGIFKYSDELMLTTFADTAFDSMIVGLEALLESSETGITIRDLGFYSY